MKSSSTTTSLTASTVLTTVAMATSLTALLYCLKPKKQVHTKSTKTTYLLVGDIGGTNTRLAIYSTDTDTDSTNDKKNDKQKQPLYTNEYQNEDYVNKEDFSFEHSIFLPFLSECQSKRNDLNWNTNTFNIVSCFAVAGPVHNNKVTLTNLGGHYTSSQKVDATRLEIVLDGNSIEQNSDGLLSCIVKCKVVNDFVGQGYGLLDLDLDTEVIELVPNSRKMLQKDAKSNHNGGGPKACVGAGTGLGQCFLTTSSLHPEEGYQCYPSEGGHVDFVPRDDLQVKLLNYLRHKFSPEHCVTARISVERVVSGKGLANVYEFLSKEFPNKINTAIHKEFQNASALQGMVVGVNANKKDDDVESCVLCKQAMDIMMSAYGAEVGNCALKYIPTGGLYVSGGLTPKNINYIQGDDSPFMKAYKDKGRMSALLDTIPLFAVLVQDLGLRGARVCALREYNNMC
jgi:glucokinase